MHLTSAAKKFCDRDQDKRLAFWSTSLIYSTDLMPPAFIQMLRAMAVGNGHCL